ncbi:hypothetical protein B0H10DRAFT_2221780 [Mycena sp. CBHHK59/15]|nr:hypothetical protein B0H10DRAFT_2221780 [Mycena sp. CBHHK59/15]
MSSGWLPQQPTGRYPLAPSSEQLLVRAARAWLEEAEKADLAGEARGLAPMSRAADTPSPQASSKPMQHSRESILMEWRAHGDHL